MQRRKDFLIRKDGNVLKIANQEKCFLQLVQQVKVKSFQWAPKHKLVMKFLAIMRKPLGSTKSIAAPSG
jgi:hypothetical protein